MRYRGFLGVLLKNAIDETERSLLEYKTRCNLWGSKTGCGFYCCLNNITRSDAIWMMGTVVAYVLRDGDI